MIDEIKTLYKSFKSGKNIFIMEVANEFGISPTSVRNNWFGTFWAIPAEKQPRVLEMLKAEIHSRQVSA